MRTLTRVGVTFLVAQALSSAAAWACSCAGDTLSAEEKLGAFETVFVGTVRGHRSGCDANPFSESSLEPTYFTLEVSRAFKGVAVGDNVEIETASDGASCGVDFEIGDSWLIYTNDGTYGLCDPGGEAAEVADEIADLEALSE